LENKRLMMSQSGTSMEKKAKPVVFPREVLSFLETILKPADLKHTSSQADFIRNEVLREISAKVKRCHYKRSY